MPEARALSPGRAQAGRKISRHPLVSVIARMMTAQAGASAAIGLAYSRRNVPWLVLTILVALALCGLAAMVRSGSHAAWLIAISGESALAAIGLFRFAYARYMGGTLLAMVSLGALLHPAVARAFGRPGAEQPGLAESPEALTEPAVG